MIKVYKSKHSNWATHSIITAAIIQPCVKYWTWDSTPLHMSTMMLLTQEPNRMNLMYFVFYMNWDNISVTKSEIYQ